MNKSGVHRGLDKALARGFNFRMTEIQAAIGISQFKSLNFFITQRNKNRNLIIKSLKNDKRWNNQVQFLIENSKVRASWFGISMLIHPMYKPKLKQILKEAQFLETRKRKIALKFLFCP